MHILINGLQIAYETQGQGRDLLLLHGWGCTKEIFHPLMDALKQGMRVTAIDFPGFGGSDTPPDTYGVPEYMELTAEFMRRNGLSGADMLCHSFGGRVGILLAATYPELVGKIVFTGSAGLKKKRPLRYHARVCRYKLMKRAARRKMWARLLKAVGIDAQKIVQNAGSPDYRALPDGMRKVFVRIVSQDLKPYLKRIRSPSLLIWGENDAETPLAFGKTMEKEIPDAGLVVLPDAGHYAFLEQFARFLTIVRHFLGG